ncbi:Lrp/AsnC family transcriptional regulator [Aquimarina hainanensis]|uniref:Lrp/AsnC family transcriptional regulator n=1 Tax=Aquimarina hainanensis TaxID=1578017 RepID=A0ABW5N6Y9_9FLAO|nr:Lrp/AsnC family transcriptional regulator [Aquimarina sp. TRL1]QKX05477.1 Lrp/AsnC family transcriptional regulator [Aquimarina sp. TRL1]
MELLDNTDKTILRILQRDSKKTAKEIANLLNLTVSPIYERIKRLEKRGYIEKYVAIVNKNLIDLPITAFCQVSLQSHHESFIDKFENQILNLKEVQECYHMAGQVDFLLKINMRSLEEYHEFVRTKLSKIENIGILNTTFSLKVIKQTSELYL